MERMQSGDPGAGFGGFGGGGAQNVDLNDLFEQLFGAGGRRGGFRAAGGMGGFEDMWGMVCGV